MPIDMSQHFTLGKLLRFTLPTIGMMLFMSAYVMAGGFFVSNFCGSTALAAVNFAYPIPMILGTVGFMLGTGGSAIVAKTRGEGDDARANAQFSLLVWAAVMAGVGFAAVGLGILRPLLALMGAQGAMMDDCLAYGYILVAGVPFTILQYLFQELMITAGKPSLAFGVTFAAGIANVVLDAALIVGAGMEDCLAYGYILVAGVPFTILQYLFQELMITAGKPSLAFGVTFAAGIANVVLDAALIVGAGMGVAGAAIGTIAGEAIGGIIPLVYFARPNGSFLSLGRPVRDWRTLGHACLNGSSDMVSNIAMSVVSIAYNVQLLSYLGEGGVAAYGVIMYVGMAFVAVFMGYIVGSSPLMSFQHGARNTAEMRSLFRKSLGVVAVGGVAMFAAMRLLATPLAGVFVGYDAGLVELTVHAFLLYSPAMLLAGFNMYGSALFTALGNGVVSAIISFVRTLVCEVGAVMLLPLVLGPDGIWLSVCVAEAVALLLTSAFAWHLAPVYGYARQPGLSRVA